MKRVLVVDDDPVIRRMVCLTLMDAFECVTASDGVEALEILKRDPQFDCVVLDYAMPVLDGGKVLTAMKADTRLAAIPVLMLTSEESARLYRDLMRMGAAVFVYKPFERKKLKTLVSVLAGLGGRDGDDRRVAAS